jgi:hypothetical protein
VFVCHEILHISIQNNFNRFSCAVKKSRSTSFEWNVRGLYSPGCQVRLLEPSKTFPVLDITIGYSHFHRHPFHHNKTVNSFICGTEKSVTTNKYFSYACASLWHVSDASHNQQECKCILQLGVDIFSESCLYNFTHFIVLDVYLLYLNIQKYNFTCWFLWAWTLVILLREEHRLQQSRDSSVGIALGYGLDDRCSRVRFSAEAGNVFLNHRVQNSSGAHAASYPMGTRGSFPGGKAAGAWS